MIIMMAAARMTRENRSLYHQKTRIKLETIRMKETKVEKPSAWLVCTMVMVCMI